MKQNSPGVFINLEFARGFAALMILAFHVLCQGKERYHFFAFDIEPYKSILKSGVDLFFIISGFLMMHTTKHLKNRHAKEFLLKRFIRIFPAYWLVVIPLIIGLMLKPSFFQRPDTTILNVIRALFLIPDNDLPILNVSWTLSYEVYFYMLFSLTLFLKPVKQFLALSSIFIASFLTGFFILPSNHFLQMVTNPLLLEFIVGMGLAFILPLISKRKILAFALILVVILWFILAPFPDANRIITSGIPSLLILTALLCLEENKIKFPARLSLFLGGISYVLYLVHFPILAAFAHLNIPKEFALIAAIFFSFLIATLLHYKFEILVQKKLRRLFALHKQPPQNISFENLIS